MPPPLLTPLFSKKEQMVPSDRNIPDSFDGFCSLWLGANSGGLDEEYAFTSPAFFNQFNRIFFRNILAELLQFISLRSRSNTSGLTYYIPQYKTTRLQRSLKYTGVKIWNKIPNWIKTKSYSQFLKHLKLYLQGN